MKYQQLLKRNVTLFRWLSFFDGFIFIAPIWVSFYTRIISFSQLAILSALHFGLIMILELPTGAIADIIGRRKTIILGLILLGIGQILLAFSFNVYTVFIFFLICSIGEVFMSGSDTAIIYDSLKELGIENKFSSITANNHFIFRIALIIAFFLGGYLYEFHIALPFILMGLTKIVAIPLVIMMVEPKIDSVKYSLKNYIQQTKQGFNQLIKNGYIKRLSIYYGLIGGITYSCLHYFNLAYAKNIGLSNIEVSWYFAVIYLITSVAVVKLSGSKLIDNKNLVYLMFPVLMIVSLVPGMVAGKSLGLILLFGTIFTGLSRFTILDKYTNQEILSKYRATAISSLNMFVSFIYIIIVGLSGIIQDQYGTKLIFSFLGLISLLVILPISINLVKINHKH